MTYKELKQKLDTLTEQQLAQTAIIFSGDEETGSEIDSWDETDADIYWLDGDCYGMKGDVVELMSKDETVSIEDFHIVPKGYFTLSYTPSDILLLQRKHA